MIVLFRAMFISHDGHCAIEFPFLLHYAITRILTHHHACFLNESGYRIQQLATPSISLEHL